MHITQIELSNRRINPETHDDCAEVAFHSKGTVTRIQANAPRAAPKLDLIRDAVRQLRRMPEIRSGQDKLSFERLCIQ